ncbi:MAG: hypothetical protein A3C53_04240 [Omnitrophica WOR_2 bacterium RIFCSPHIGHO2_02_FULL_68_15]|nr:MAG: hypothetical protein A3C53_04240 [Omnitrophica WOR_2 bacterium RIFCSPHIGHO2_02_FULL_68_15]
MTGPWRRRLRLLGQAVALVLPLIVFFAVYERVMVDTNLRQLRLALTVFQQAPDVSRAEAAMALVDQNLLYTIALAQPSPVELATLEYAKTVLAGDPQRSVADAQAMVSDAVAQRLAARGGVVGTLDDLNNTIQRVLQRVALMPRAVLRRSPLSDEINLELLRQALADERLGEFAKAERAFEQLLREFPAYRGRDDLLLRLGYLHHRRRAWASAERRYREALEITTDPVSAGIARQLLDQLKKAHQWAADAIILRQRLAAETDPLARQEVAFNLGGLQMRLFEFDQAIENFHLAAEAAPQTPLAAQATFRQAWCLKYLGRYEEALTLFETLQRPGVEPATATIARTSAAAALHAAGQYDAAVELLGAAAGQAQDQALASLLTAQAGAVALLDQRDTASATGHFRHVEEAYPASTASTLRDAIQQLQAMKQIVPSEATQMAPAVPVLGWLETVLPAAVETFARRLAETMAAAGERDHARRLTEQDCQQYVIRRIQQRFPKQLRDVQVMITPDGFQGSADVAAAELWFPVTGAAQIAVVTGRPHVRLTRLSVGHLPIPQMVLQVLSDRVNAAVDQAQWPLVVHRFVPAAGAVDISVSLVESP